MPGWALTGGAVGLVALVIWFAVRGGGGAQAQTIPAPSGSPTQDGGTTSGGSVAGGSDQGQPFLSIPSLVGTSLDNYQGTSGDPAVASASVAASSPFVAAAAPTPSSGSGGYVDSYHPGTIYADPSSTTGFSAQQPAGVFQPAYIGPSGAFVSPGTYAGYGVTPGPVSGPEQPTMISSSMVSPAPISAAQRGANALMAQGLTPAPPRTGGAIAV